MTAAEVLEAKGRAEGKVQGKIEGKAELILRLVRLKFGEVPEAVRGRVVSAASEELDGWAERIITASTLDELP
ncbi:MAG TPA: DUF4351 domain-containing protein [Polyangiaceae bacterium]|nr:DUF4351 domain-containing protein [Polyangiaceae bacterium]